MSDRVERRCAESRDLLPSIENPLTGRRRVRDRAFARQRNFETLQCLTERRHKKQLQVVDLREPSLSHVVTLGMKASASVVQPFARPCLYVLLLYDTITRTLQLVSSRPFSSLCLDDHQMVLGRFES